jgi:2-amino-4-hydroxy-6-hydroxymethyldihydropteridine diphosphokinase
MTVAPAAGLTRAYIALGANLGDARGTLEVACAALAALPQSAWGGRSRYFRTAPIDSTGPDYLNAVAVLDTALEPLDLLAALQHIEGEHGRLRPYRNAPRTLDLDLLLYGDAVIDLPTLQVPHPRGHLRAFVLAPLLDVAPALTWPGQGTVASLLERVADQAIQALD